MTATLRRKPPLLHGAGDTYFGLAWKALEWIEASVTDGMHTLETGTGASTIVFAARGARHIAISPAAGEHDRIRSYCAEQGISTEKVEFVDETSHTALQRLRPEPLDIVLIDGAHGFPFPVLDWYFVQDKLKVGGAMVIDDAYIPAVNGLVERLRAMRGWRLEAAPGGRTAVFRKTEHLQLPFDASAEAWAPVFNYLPPPQRLVAGLRVRALDRGPLAEVLRRRTARRSGS